MEAVMTRIGKCLFVFLLIMLPHNTVAQTCCQRTIAVLPIGDTGITHAFESPLHRDSAKSDCHPYSIMSLRGRKALERLTEEIGRVSGAPPDPQAQKISAEFLDLDYLFIGNLSTSESERTGASYTLKMKYLDHHHGQSLGTAGIGGWNRATGKLRPVLQRLDSDRDVAAVLRVRLYAHWATAAYHGPARHRRALSPLCGPAAPGTPGERGGGQPRVCVFCGGSGLLRGHLPHQATQ